MYRNLRNLQADSFFDSATNLTEYGLDNPKGFIQVNLKDKSLNIYFGSKNDKEYFQIDKKGTVYQAVGLPSQTLLKPEDSFRDGSQFKFDPFLAQSIVLKQGDQALFTLKQDKNEWSFDGKDKADTPVVREYLKTLSGLAISKFLPLSAKIDSKTAKYSVSVTIDEQDGSKPRDLVLVIGDKLADGGYPAMVLGADEPFILTEDQLKQVTPATERFKMVATSKPS